MEMAATKKKHCLFIGGRVSIRVIFFHHLLDQTGINADAQAIPDLSNYRILSVALITIVAVPLLHGVIRATPKGCEVVGGGILTNRVDASNDIVVVRVLFAMVI